MPDTAGAMAPQAEVSPQVLAAHFREGRRCYFARAAVAMAERVADACRSDKDHGATRQQQAACQAGLDELRAQAKSRRPDRARCADAASVGGDYYEATRAAAMAGDVDARLCYLLSMFENIDGTPLPVLGQDLPEYRRLAPRFIADGLARGDWRTVELLRTDFVDGPSLLPLVVRNDPVAKYEMTRLLQLGADGAYAHQLEFEIQAVFLTPGDSTPPALTPRQAAEATERARALYHRHFEGGPRLTTDPVPCRSD